MREGHSRKVERPADPKDEERAVFPRTSAPHPSRSVQRSLADFMAPKDADKGKGSSAAAAAAVDVDGETATASQTVPSAPMPSSCTWLPSLLTDPEWRVRLAPLMADSWRNAQFHKIEQFLDAEMGAGKTVLPPRPDIFAAFNKTPLSSAKVVILGQDPYHDIGQAHGLCFSVRPGVRVPPSLQNMYKELAVDIPGFKAPHHGCLESWAEQGVLMLNATLTVEAHKANSHANIGWQLFTDDVIRALSSPTQRRRMVFLLWGNFARKKKSLIDLTKHVVIENAHPSPLSAKAWFGCRCFSKCNAALQKLGHTPVNWNLPLTL